MTKKLGVYDSGMGGFSLVKEILKDPFVSEIYYYSDYERLPYGNLTTQELEARGVEICEYLLNQNVDAILLACNTATVNTINYMRQKFSVPFVGVEPYINAIKKEDSLANKNMIGLIVTPATAKSDRVNWLKGNFDQDDRVTIIASENLARSIEHYIRGEKEKRAIIESELSELKQMGFDGLILGCTHYPLVMSLFDEILDIPIIDPSPFVIQQLRKVLGQENTLRESCTNPIISFSENLKSGWSEMDKEQIKQMI